MNIVEIVIRIWLRHSLSYLQLYTYW